MDKIEEYSGRWGKKSRKERERERKINVEIEMLKDRKRWGRGQRAEQLPQDVNLLLSKHALQGQFSNCK